jgi:hypothetical protein
MPPLIVEAKTECEGNLAQIGIGQWLASYRADEGSSVEILIVTVVGILGFAVAFGLALGALDLLFSALAPMRPAFAPYARATQDANLQRPLRQA